MKKIVGLVSDFIRSVPIEELNTFYDKCGFVIRGDKCVYYLE